MLSRFPHVGPLAKLTMQTGGPSALCNRVQNQRWPTNGWMGYTTPTVLGAPLHSRAGDKISIGQQAGGLATQPLPLGGGSTMLQGGVQN